MSLMRALCIVFVAGCGFQSPAGETGGMSLDANASGSDSTCPVNYDLNIPGPSRYRLIADGHRAWEQSDACDQDMQGMTHLAVIETPQELEDVRTFLKNPGSGLATGGIWIGAVQRMSATSPRDGWLGFDGADLFNGWGGTEPNDGLDNNENDHSEQFVVMEKGLSFFIDIPGNSTFSALCECDGKPIDSSVATLVASYH